MKKLMLIFILLQTVALSAQQAYLDKVIGVSDDYRINLAVSDSLIIVSGKMNPDQRVHNVATVNLKGDILDSIYFSMQSNDSLYGDCAGCIDFIQSDGNKFVFHANPLIFTDSVNGYAYWTNSVLCHIYDLNLNILNEYVIERRQPYIGVSCYDVLVDDNNNIIISGVGFRVPQGNINGKYDLWVAKYDSDLNLLWETFVPDNRGDLDSHGPVGEHISLDAYNSVVVSGWGRYGPNNAFAARLNLDDGSLYWYKAFDSPYGSGGMSVVDRGDGKYVFVQNLGTELSASGTSITKTDLNIGIMDTTGLVLQQKRIGPRGELTLMTKLLKLADGNYYVAGLTNLEAMGVKFKSNLDSIWHRTYYHIEPEDRTSFESAAELDGGFILNAGNYQDWKLDPVTPKEGIWLLKIDNHGCAYAGCHLVGVPERTLNLQLMAFPNPTTGPFTVDYQSGAKANSSKAFSYHIINTQGQLVEEGIFNGNTTYDLSHHPKGIYFFHVFTEGYLVWGAKVVKE